MTVPSVDARNENVAALLDWAKTELAHARERLEAPTIEWAESQLLRGRIHALREFVEGIEPTPQAIPFELDRKAFLGDHI